MTLSPLLLALVLGVPALSLLALRLFPRARVVLWWLDERRDQLGQRARDLTVAAAYHSRVTTQSRSAGLDERTWQDLDLDAVFLSLDRSESLPGQQYLYHLLHSPHSAREPLERLERAVRRVAEDADLSLRLRQELRKLANPRAGRLIHVILDEPPKRPSLWWTLPLLTVGSIVSLTASVFWPGALIILAMIVLANVGVQVLYRPSVAEFAPALRELPAFLRVSVRLGALEAEELADQCACLRENVRTMESLRRATRWVVAEPAMMGELVGMVYEYANMFFLLDVNAFMFATASLRSSRTRLRAMFEALGHIDAVQSVAAWRSELPRWTTPEFIPREKTAHLEGVAHPLLDDPVANSLDVADAGVLITGSNMSGKTTFLRALGVNAVLAQTVHTVYADQWRVPMLCVRTSIGRADSLLEGKSYYLAEVESVGALIAAKDSGRQHLFLLDEIFRGTNTSERVAAAYAVLSHLTKGDDIVIVATHDIEVTSLLGTEYVTFHFREEITNGALSFDYKIRPGPCSTRNAIALLELMRYPPSLVADARAALDWQRRDGSVGSLL